MDDQFHPRLRRRLVAKRVHVPELPHRVDMEEREGRRGGLEGLAGEVEQDRAVLARRIEQNRPLRLGRRLAENMDRFRLEALEVGQAHRASP